MKSVTIISAETRVNSVDKSTFVVLIVAGGIYSAISRTSGRSYNALLTASVRSPLSLEQSKLLIGSTMPGSIVRKDSPVHKFTGRDGKEYESSHTYEFVQEN